jgi:hypothetical protein
MRRLFRMLRYMWEDGAREAILGIVSALVLIAVMAAAQEGFGPPALRWLGWTLWAVLLLSLAVVGLVAVTMFAVWIHDAWDRSADR